MSRLRINVHRAVIGDRSGDRQFAVIDRQRLRWLDRKRAGKAHKSTAGIADCEAVINREVIAVIDCQGPSESRIEPYGYAD